MKRLFIYLMALYCFMPYWTAPAKKLSDRLERVGNKLVDPLTKHLTEEKSADALRDEEQEVLQTPEHIILYYFLATDLAQKDQTLYSLFSQAIRPYYSVEEKRFIFEKRTRTSQIWRLIKAYLPTRDLPKDLHEALVTVMTQCTEESRTRGRKRPQKNTTRENALSTLIAQRQEQQHSVNQRATHATNAKRQEAMRHKQEQRTQQHQEKTAQRAQDIMQLHAQREREKRLEKNRQLRKHNRYHKMREQETKEKRKKIHDERKEQVEKKPDISQFQSLLDKQ